MDLLPLMPRSCHYVLMLFFMLCNLYIETFFICHNDRGCHSRVTQDKYIHYYSINVVLTQFSNCNHKEREAGYTAKPSRAIRHGQ